MNTLTRNQVREVDRRAIEECGMTGLVLMENAGRGVADFIGELRVPGPVVICCGAGNNGGDGFVIARHLDARQVPVRVLLLAKEDSLRGDALANFQILQHTDVSIEVLPEPLAEVLDAHLKGAGTLVEALLGTGARGEPRPPLDRAIDAMNRAAGAKLAIDIPSGLDCDTGAAATHTFRADHTCTFVAAKPGLLIPEVATYVGTLRVIDIGVPRRLVEQIQSEDR